eukprot:jgi/Galph1/4154/GphlegSOOS_G2794.1
MQSTMTNTEEATSNVQQSETEATLSSRSVKDSPCKIFIGQLPANVVEEDLHKLCEPHGTVLETTIVRNRATNQSRGCGFCVFHSREEAMKAIQSLHNTKPFVNGTKPLQVRFAERNNDFSEKKLYIGHLDPLIEETQLRAVFSSFGDVVDVNIVRPRNAENSNATLTNYGFIEFSNSEAADNAVIAAKNGQVWLENGNPLTEVRYARVSRNRGRNSDGYYTKERGLPEGIFYDPSFGFEGWPPMDTNALSSPPLMTQPPPPSFFPPPPHPYNYFPFSNHMTGPPMELNGNDSHGSQRTSSEHDDSTREVAQENFANQPNLASYYPYGMYPTAAAPMTGMWNADYGDPKTAASFGSTNWFQSLYPYSAEYAEYLAAAAGANAPSYETQQNRMRGPSECNLFVYGIPPDWDDAMLANLFLPFGKILSSNVFIDKRTQRSKGFGFVSYAYPDSAHMAISMLNGMTLPNGRTLKVSLKKDKNDNYSD